MDTKKGILYWTFVPLQTAEIHYFQDQFQFFTILIIPVVYVIIVKWSSKCYRCYLNNCIRYIFKNNLNVLKQVQTSILLKRKCAGIVFHLSNPNTREANEGGSLALRSVWLHRETLFKTKQNKNEARVVMHAYNCSTCAAEAVRFLWAQTQ